MRREATALAFEQFIASRKSSPSKGIQTAQPSDVIAFVCWLVTCGKRHRTVFHAMHCESVGTASLASCSMRPESCNRRYTYDSFRTNYVSKLSIFYEHDLGITSAWNDTLRRGNPVRSHLVVQYMPFTGEEEKKAGVSDRKMPLLKKRQLREKDEM